MFVYSCSNGLGITGEIGVEGWWRVKEDMNEKIEGHVWCTKIRNGKVVQQGMVL